MSSNVILEDVAVLCECCLSGCDSSFNPLFLVIFSGAVSQSQVHVAVIVLDLGVVETLCGVLVSIITFVVNLFIFRPPEFQFDQLILVAFVVGHMVC